jgi:hypothetical protein
MAICDSGLPLANPTIESDAMVVIAVFPADIQRVYARLRRAMRTGIRLPQ